MGSPDEDPPPRDRLPLKGLIHFDKYLQPTDTEMAQIYTKLKHTRESHIDYSETVTSFLKTQGFL